MIDVKPFVIRFDSGLKQRVVDQCNRLSISQSSFIKMAVVRFVEEEEKNHALVLKR